MSVMDKLKQMLKGHEEQAGKGVDKGADLAKKKAGGKYDQPIDLDPRLSPLAPELRETVRGICSPIMERFGYS